MRATAVNLNLRYRINIGLIEKISARVLGILKKKGIELEVIFLDDRKMRALNKTYKGRDAATDVLSFGYEEGASGRMPAVGTIYISLDTARRNAKVFKTSFQEETVLYVIHGILHLAGYDDRTGGQRLRMSNREKGILQIICMSEDLSKVSTLR